MDTARMAVQPADVIMKRRAGFGHEENPPTDHIRAEDMNRRLALAIGYGLAQPHVPSPRQAFGQRPRAQCFRTILGREGGQKFS